MSQKISFDLYNKALSILESVRSKYVGQLEKMFGPVLDETEARVIYDAWVKKNNFIRSKKYETVPELEFSSEILCSAKLTTTGPKKIINKPEKRKYKLIVRVSTHDNIFIRKNTFEALLRKF